MTAPIPALVEGSLLRWARETAGLSATAASRRLGHPDDAIQRWEEGDGRPSIDELREIAKLYRRSFAVFFLNEPPATFDTMRDFRRLDSAIARPWSVDLHDEYRRAIYQRDAAIEIYELEGRQASGLWSVAQAGGDDALASKARAQLLGLGVPLPDPRYRSTAYLHINAWTAMLEEAGVLVMATRGGAVKLEEMRAFSLYDENLPVIVLNGADWPRGRLFSLLHEYAHLLLHTAGLCDVVTDLRATHPDRVIEAQCNRIAAAILMPKGEVERRVEKLPGEGEARWTYEALTHAAEPFGVSAEAFLRRLVSLDLAGRAFYEMRREEFLAAYEEAENLSKPAGGNWYFTTARDLGKGYVRLVSQAHQRQAIDSYSAASYLGVKIDQIAQLAHVSRIPGQH